MCLELERLKREAGDNGHQICRVAEDRYECAHGCDALIRRSLSLGPSDWVGSKIGNWCPENPPTAA